MNMRFYFLLSLVLIGLIGCQPSNSVQADNPALSPTFENSDIVTQTMTSNTPDPAGQKLVQRALAQLAEKLGMEAKDIFVFSVEAVEWPDASLGCPQAGMSYAQVISPGYRLVLEAKGQVYIFHTDDADQVILCTARGPDEIYLPP